jgi:flavodoxin
MAICEQPPSKTQEMAKHSSCMPHAPGETEKIGNLIAEGIRFSGHEADVVKVTDIKKEDDLKGYDAVVFGSPTYHGEMVQGMKTLLFMAEKAELEGKVGGAFGAFGWSGEAPDRIFRHHEKHLQNEHGQHPLAAQVGQPGRRHENGPGLRAGDRRKTRLTIIASINWKPHNSNKKGGSYVHTPTLPRLRELQKPEILYLQVS